MLTQSWPETATPAMDDGVMELSLMMSRRQFEALEERARDEGMTVAQFLRRLVQQSIDEPWRGEAN